MNSQHLSDEAVAAFADGCLRGHARERAARHTRECGECARDVQVQRDAAWALRAAPAPCLPSGLADRLRGLADVTPITGVPMTIDPDGSAMFSTAAPSAMSPPSSLAPTPSPLQPQPTARGSAHRGHPFASTTAAVVALAGVVTSGSYVADRSWLETDHTTAVQQVAPGQPDVTPTVNSINLLRPIGR